MHKAQRLINHVALVLDGSSSMSGHTKKLIEVADEQIKHLALRSEELSQETRVSVYLFAYDVQCLIFDMDVMRLPSIKDLYRANGMTALIDAVLKSQEDLATTSQLYGDHAFLTFVLTDGQENRSKNSWTQVTRLLANSKDNWTVGFLVPDANGAAYMNRIGADPDSIAIWDTTSTAGLVEAVSTIRTATDNFMQARASGTRGTKKVFATIDVERVNARAVKTNLTPLASNTYLIDSINSKARINDYIRSKGLPFKVGMGYYQLTKEETVQPYKKVIVVDKRTGKAYSGEEARRLIGLPDGVSVKVRPSQQPDYDIYIQSTSPTRNLLPGTKVLIRT